MAITSHGTCLDLEGFGVLILGQSGSGKSDLALRLTSAARRPGFMLVADDRYLVERQEGNLLVRPPEALAGLLEIRGVGIVRMDYRPQTRLGLIVRLTSQQQIERLPDFPRRRTELEGVRLPVLDLWARENAAPDKLHAAVQVLRGALSLATDGPGAV